MVLFISNDVTAQVLGMHDAMAALDAVMREEGLGSAANRHKANIHIPHRGAEEVYRYCSMEGGSRELGVVAVRIKSDMMTSAVVYGQLREQKYASRPGKYCGLVYLFSATNAEPLAILNDGVIQHVRVGATYGLGAKYLARPDSRTLGLLGSGGMARTFAESAALALPLERVKVFSPNIAHRDAFAEEMAERTGIDVVPVGSAEDAAADVDVLAAMTDSLEPLISPEMLRPGMHVCGVHGEMSRAALEMVDCVASYVSGKTDNYYTAPESWKPRRDGEGGGERTGEGRPRQTLVDIMLGRAAGRTDPSSITYFHSLGTGTQFAATAKLVYDRARERNLGHELPLDWFLQDMRD